MERHPNRESVIGLYLREHLGTDKVRISENPSTLVIVFCIDDQRGRRRHPLRARCRPWSWPGPTWSEYAHQRTAPGPDAPAAATAAGSGFLPACGEAGRASSRSGGPEPHGIRSRWAKFSGFIAENSALGTVTTVP